MLTAAGERGVSVNESALDTGFRMRFGDFDYRPETGVLELTSDKAAGKSISSAGLVVLEVGRALQYRRRFLPVIARDLMAPVANVAGFIWVLPAVGANILPMVARPHYGPEFDLILYLLSTGLAGTVGLYLLLKIPVDFDAARRGVAAMVKARIFSAGEALAVLIFLGIILGLTAFATLIIAFNILRSTAPTRKG